MNKRKIKTLFYFISSCCLLGCLSPEKKVAIGDPKIIDPPRNARQVQLMPSFDWSVPATANASNVRFDLLVDTSNPPTNIVASDIETNNYSFTKRLQPRNVYYWQVIAKADEQQTVSEIYPFTTGRISVPIISIDVDRSNIRMVEGERTQLRAKITPQNASDKNIIWSTSDATVVGVSSAGLIVGIGQGRATITASSKDRRISTPISVVIDSNVIYVVDIILNKTKLNLVASAQERISTIIVPANASNRSLAWTTQDISVASVRDNGIITAQGNGTTIITVTNPVSGISTNCEVNVIGSSVSVRSISLSKSSLFLTLDSSEVLVATIFPENANNKTVIWRSSNNDVAIVDNTGVVRSLQEGNSIITATTEDGDYLATATVTVNSILVSVSSVDIQRTSITLKKNELTPLIAETYPSDASNKTITWTSSNLSVAQVNNRGTVTGISEGNATITVTTEDGNFTDICDIKVIIPATSIEITPSPLSIDIGSIVTLSSSLIPEEASDQNILWSSDDNSVATINSKGDVRGVSSGVTNIRVSVPDSDISSSITVEVRSREHHFKYNNRDYYIVFDAKTWKEATGIAVLKAGYLVHIDNAEEQAEIENQLRSSSFTFAQSTIEPDNKRYIWIGATDQNTSTVWTWDGDNKADNTEFGRGYAPNNWTPTSNSYHNWGQNSSTSQQYQPDNGAYAGITNEQHYGAMALDNWEYGQQYQWDDINGSNRMPYIIEVESS